MWSYLATPFLVLVPARWRRDVIFTAPPHWRVASFMCGVVQCVTGFVALVWWYSYSVTTWTHGVIEHRVETQDPVNGLSPEAFGMLGFTIVAANPITWLIVIWCVEGIARLLAAVITEEVFATFPLALIAGAIAMVRPVREENPGLQGGNDATLDRSPAGGFASFLRRGMLERTHGRVTDHVTLLRDADGEVLKVCASHTKAEWDVGRIVRVSGDGTFWRLESFVERDRSAAYGATGHDDGLPRGTAAAGAVADGHSRRFVYKLRRLGAGVMNRNVLTYELPEDFVWRAEFPEPVGAHQMQRK